MCKLLRKVGRADIFISCWGSGSKGLACDDSVVNPLAVDLAARSASEAGHGLATTNKMK